MNLKDLKYFINNSKEIAKDIDDDKYFFTYENTPLIFDWKSEGFKIEYILTKDIFDWLCYLVLSDGNISNKEVKFINYCLDLKFTKNQLRKLAIYNLNKDFENHIPISFVLLYEAEILNKDLMMSQEHTYSEEFFGLFLKIGELFISCDGKTTDYEETLYREYICLLSENLKDFKSRRGIDATYKHLVGKNVSPEDITLNKNSKKEIANKMNLILKLISQGYSLYDLNNIAYLSIEVIAKWFCLGRLGDKCFEEFYLKCIKLNPSLENEIDNIIEDIDIVNIDEDIYIYNKNKLPPKSKNETDIQKDHFYKLQIDKLKSHFEDTEEKTRKLIEKRFPAPQMTNTKFIHHVDKCSKIFNDKIDNVKRMIESKTNYTNKLENEIKTNINSLTGINDELDSLNEELLINMSKSGQKDIENLFEDMEELINSVKYY